MKKWRLKKLILFLKGYGRSIFTTLIFGWKVIKVIHLVVNWRSRIRNQVFMLLHFSTETLQGQSPLYHFYSPEVRLQYSICQQSQRQGSKSLVNSYNPSVSVAVASELLVLNKIALIEHFCFFLQTLFIVNRKTFFILEAISSNQECILLQW